MVEYKPGIEHSGVRSVSARVREFWHAHRLICVAAILAAAALAVEGLAETGKLDFGERFAARYCTHCGIVVESSQVIVFSVPLFSDNQTYETFVSRWLAGRGMKCENHDWATAIMSSSWGGFFVRFQGSGGDRNRIWEYGRLAPIHSEEAAQYQFILDSLARRNEKLAMKLVAGLLSEDDHWQYWRWLETQPAGSRDNPAQAVESFSEFVKRTKANDSEPR